MQSFVTGKLSRHMAGSVYTRVDLGERVVASSREQAKLLPAYMSCDGQHIMLAGSRVGGG